MNRFYDFVIETTCRGKGYVTAASEEEARDKILRGEAEDIYDYDYDVPHKVVSLKAGEEVEGD